MAELRFDGRVALITGAGRNLGRAYALLLASRGARVVVNDFGVGISDTDGAVAAPDENPAHSVVREIVAAGGEAVVDTGSIADPDASTRMIATAIDSFGRLDIVVNNAGVVRQAAVEDYTDRFCRDMVDTHVLGTMNVTRAAWPVMKAAGYGRIVHVSSGAAFGIAGMSMYSTVKMAVIGMTRAQALEGAPYGINVNVIAPYASVRGNPFGGIPWSPALADWLSAEQVAPLTAYLAHETCSTSGEWFTVGGGHASRVAIAVHDGFHQRPSTPEVLQEHWAEVLGDPAEFRLEAPGGSTAVRSMFRGFQP